MRILMVCLGNICRSPIAEGVLQHMADKQKLSWQIDSAGTSAHFHEGRSPHPHSISICTQNQVDISQQSARSFQPLDFGNYDLIYAMSVDIYDHLIKVANGKSEWVAKVKLLRNEVNQQNESVPDPYYDGESAYLPVYKMIHEACEKIIQRYS